MNKLILKTTKSGLLAAALMASNLCQCRNYRGENAERCRPLRPGSTALDG